MSATQKSSWPRRKVISFLVISACFTLAVLSFHPAFDNNGLVNSMSVESVKRNFLPDEQNENTEANYVSSQEKPVEEDKKDHIQFIRPQLESVWTYRCHDTVGCVRELREKDGEVVEPEVCWLNCGAKGALWPYPTGKTVLGGCPVPFDRSNVKITSSSPSTDSQQILERMQDIFLDRFQKMIPENDLKQYEEQHKSAEAPEDNPSSTISIKIAVSDGNTSIGLGTDESYSLAVLSNNSKCMNREPQDVQVEIKANTIFGTRHALETLGQLTAYDRQNHLFRIVGNAEIQDSPAHPYRGLLMDTARNFIPVADLKRMLDAMSYNKLNMFHWHISDSNSFPFYSNRVPEMTQYGAYSSSKVYFPEEVKDIVDYAKYRGVKVIVELDAPAHAGNGWQWGPSKGLGNLAVCVNAESWRSVGGQPPTGQLNPANPNVYDVLEKIYEDLLELFDGDLFHMGGDEVNTQCWATEPTIREWMNRTQGNNYNYMALWGYFQEEAYKRLKMANGDKPLRPIVWTSGMTASPEGRKFLNSSEYIIQVWETGNDPVIKALLHEGYKLIISNVDVMYLDHGGGSWLGKDHIYDYRQWQIMYDNHMKKFSPSNTSTAGQILGGEIALWAEKVNAFTMDSKTWPRASAVAENLWSDPVSRPPLVYSRLNHHTNRMIQLGIRADQLQPESCYQLTGHCSDPSKPF